MHFLKREAQRKHELANHKLQRVEYLYLAG